MRQPARIIALIILMSGWGLLAQTTEKTAVGEISFPLNRVFVTSSSPKALQYARFEMAVYAGDVIETKNASRCEITLYSGDVLRIGENAKLELKEVLLSDSSRQILLLLSKGKLRANTAPLKGAGDTFLVRTASADISADGANFDIETLADNTTRLERFSGDVTVAAGPPNIAYAGENPAAARMTPPPMIADSAASPADSQMTAAATWQLMISAEGVARKMREETTRSEQDWMDWNERRDRLIVR